MGTTSKNQTKYIFFALHFLLELQVYIEVWKAGDGGGKIKDVKRREGYGREMRNMNQEKKNRERD